MKFLSTLISRLIQENQLEHHTYDLEIDKKLPIAVRLNSTYQGKYLSTWGVGATEDEAYLKALIELLERITLNFSCSTAFKMNLWNKTESLGKISQSYEIHESLLHPSNSNGCGAHFLPWLAKRSAKLELIERHTILSAQLLNIAPLKINPSFLERFNKKFDIEFFYWRCGMYFVSISVLKVQKGFYFAFGCNERLELAVNKSFFELTPSIIFSFDEGRFLEGSHEIIKDDIQSFSRYWRMSKDQRYYDFLNSNYNMDKEIPQPKIFFFSKFMIPPSLELNFPFYSFRCISPEAQQLFFDNWNSQYINNKLYPKIALPDFPHPIA